MRDPDQGALKLLRAIFDSVHPPLPKELADKGWVYRDMPGRVTPEAWDLFLSILGEGNYQILVMSEGDGWRRGQFFISPQALENLKAYKAGKNN